MDQGRINLSDIVLGQPLRWNVYDATHQLLLRKGHVVAREAQVAGLIERGLYIDIVALTEHGEERPAGEQEQRSALRLLNLAQKRLEKIALGLHAETDAQEAFREVARMVLEAADINLDVALASILLNQDHTRYAIRHSVDTAVVASMLAGALEMTPEQRMSVTTAALSMNLSMLRLQDQMQRGEAALTNADRLAIRSHPDASVQMLRQAGVRDEDWLDYVLYHHENEDGSGYPFNLTAADIPLGAKIVALADRYCARVSTRGYRKVLLPNTALRDILVNEKGHIDATLAAALIRQLGIYPCGTFVRLENAETGVVSGRGLSTTAPVVHTLIGPRGAQLAQPIKRDTGRALYAIREVVPQAQVALRINMRQLWSHDAAL